MVAGEREETLFTPVDPFQSGPGPGLASHQCHNITSGHHRCYYVVVIPLL